MTFTLSINGVKQNTLYTALEYEVIEKKSFLERIGDRISEYPNDVATAFVESVAKPLGQFFVDLFVGGIELLNSASSEIITLGILAGALGMMVAPIFGSSSGTWFGRVVFVGMIGAIWRMLI